MMQVVSFTFNPFYENTYLIINENKETLIIDPGMNNPEEENLFFSYLEGNDLKPVKILNTHAHIDHIIGVRSVTERYKIPFGIHASEKDVLDGAAASAAMFGLKLNDIPKADFFIKEEQNFAFGATTIKVLFTPGHSPGSISFYAPEEAFVISGDVIFQNGIGRTDLPGGNYDQLIESIKSQIFNLPDQTKIYPGHGSISMVGIEKNSGFLAGIAPQN